MDNGNAAVVLVRTQGARVVGNVMAVTSTDGLRLNDTTGAFIDQNTIGTAATAATGSALRAVHATSSALCMRQNNLAGLWGAALTLEVGVTWSDTTDCTDPVTEGGTPLYRNNIATEGVSECATPPCDTPANFLLTPGVPVNYAGHADPTQSNYACLPADSPLIDQGRDLGYDLASIYSPSITMTPNDLIDPSSPERFTGPRPDIGARESGTRRLSVRRKQPEGSRKP